MCFVHWMFQVHPVEPHTPDKPELPDLPERLEQSDPEEENHYVSIDEVVYEDIKLATRTPQSATPSLMSLTKPQLRGLQVTTLL